MAKEKYNYDFLGGFFAFGGAGVDIFFVLSGFIITYTAAGTEKMFMDFKTFIQKRFVRIFPVYWIIITALLLLQMLLPAFYNSHYELRATALLNTYFLLPGHLMLNGVSWTLTSELFFYLIFSLSFFIKDRRWKMLLLIAYSVMLLAVAINLTAGDSNNTWRDMILFPMNIEFFMGILAASWWKRIPSTLSAFFALGGLILFFTSGYFFDTGLSFFGNALDRVILFGIPSFLLIIGVVSYEHSKEIRIPYWPVLLGEASYSLYLVHLPLVAAGLKLLGKYSGSIFFVGLILLIVFICIVSILFYKIVEKPLIGWLQKKIRLRVLKNPSPTSPKLIRITTVPMALAYPLAGQPSYMASHGFDVLMISSDGAELPQLLKNESCPHTIVPMTRSITPFRDVVCIFKLVKIFRKERPGIVHTETPKAGLLGMIAAKIAGVKIRVHTVAGMPLMTAKGIKLFILKQIEKITYACATHVWANAPSLKDFILRQNFTSRKKISVIGKGSSNGVNTERFSRTNLDPKKLDTVKQTIQYREGNIYLLFTGRLVKDKGITELVNVFMHLLKDYPNLKLILAGQYEPHLDPLPKNIEKEILNNKNIIHIQWTNEVEYYMAVADILVFPSYREGFPNVLLEAASMELPIVCSRITGNTDIVTDKETGLIFESMNEVELEQKLRTALNDPAAMKSMAERLSGIIRTTFRREQFWEDMRNEYLRISNK